jgi:hypothetical protein
MRTLFGLAKSAKAVKDTRHVVRFLPMQPAQACLDVTEHVTLCGQVGDQGFALWIGRHAGKLGLGLQFLRQTAARVEMIVSGPPDLLDAMALACSLGPQEVWVDQVDRYRTNDPLGCENASPFA